MAFIQFGSLNPHGAPVLRKSILTNSIASVVMDSDKVASGFLALGTAGALVFGHVVAHVDKNGMGLLTTGVSGAEIGSYAGAFTAASDNQTVAQVSALCDISTFTLYSCTPDATIGTTTGSNLLGSHTDLISEDTIDENNATNSFATTAQYVIWGVNPNSSTQGIYSIYESQVFGV